MFAWAATSAAPSFLLLLSASHIPRAHGQNSLALTFPPALPSTFHPQFKRSSNVRFTWDSTFDNITLQIYQGPDGQGRIESDTLLQGAVDVTEFNWRANHLRPYFTADSPFHLYLFATNNPNCNNCHSNSTKFSLQKPQPSDGAGEHDDGDEDDGGDSSLKLGLGVGLGVGIPLNAAIIGLTVWLCIRRRRKNRTTLEPDSSQRMPRPTTTALDVKVPQTPMGELATQKSPVDTGERRVAELSAERPLVEAPHDPTTTAVELEGDYGLRDYKDRQET